MGKLLLLSAVLLPTFVLAEFDWKVEPVDDICTGSRNVDVYVDAKDNVHVAYTGCTELGKEEETSGLYYGKKLADGSWKNTLIDQSSTDVGRHPHMGIDTSGGLHIIYGDNANKKLKYAYRASERASWGLNKVGTRKGGYWVSGWMHEDTFYVSHTSFKDKNLKEPKLEVGTLKNGSWSFEILRGARESGWTTDITADQNGNPVVISHDNHYYRGDIFLSNKQNGVWTHKPVDSYATREHVAVDSKGFYHIVYGQQDSLNGKLDDVVYVTNRTDDGKWKKEIIGGHETEDDDALFPEVAVDANDGVHVTYRSYKYNSLVYTRNVTGKWETQTVEAMGRPLYSHLAFDSKGGLHLAFENANMMYYGYCSNCSKQ